MKGYKVFNENWACQGYQYEVGEIFEMDESPVICKRGFHFCTKASDCFNYYSFNNENKVAEIEALGNVDGPKDDTKHCTNKIHIVREISWQELLTIVNEGKDNTGLLNTGNMNTGDRNTGNMNTGDRNTGNRNTGDMNTGNWNTGNWNTGNWNTGNWNTDNWNTGDWNIINYSSGVFCTEQQKAIIFDKPSDWTPEDWFNSDAKYLLCQIQTVFWVDSYNMTYKEKELHPEHEATGGFLKTVHITEAAEIWWNNLNDEQKSTIKSIPNFDAEKFYKIVGIRV